MKTIIYIQYTNPAGYPPLEHSSLLLADSGWQVRFLGTRAFGADELEFPPHRDVTVRLLRFQSPGWLQKLHYLWFVVWCLGTCLVRRPRVMYCSDLLSTPVGVVVWYLLRIPVVYHEHDTAGPPPNRFLRLVHLARRQLARVAKLIVIPNHERLANFERVMTPPRAVCVWNCPNRDEVRSVAKRPSRPFVLWYHGSLSPGQFPLTVIDALALLPDHVCLRFAGYETVGHVGYVREIRKRAEGVGVGKRVEYVGTPPTRNGLFDQAARANVGLALFARQFREPMAGASNKPFDYLACGLAVLVTDTPEWTDMYVRTGCGQAADPESPESIASAVRAWLANPDSAQAMGEAGRQRVLAEWNYETQFEPVKRLLERL